MPSDEKKKRKMDIRKLGRGLFAIRWRDVAGKRHYKQLPQGTTFEQAKAVLQKKLVARRSGDDPLVSQVCADYMRLNKWRSDAGRERAESIIDTHIIPAFGEMKVSQLTPMRVEAWRQTRLDVDKAKPATLDREFTTLRAVLNHALRLRSIDRSPLLPGDVDKLVKGTTGRLDYFSPGEWRLFVSALDDDGRWKAYIANKQERGPVRIGKDTGADTPRKLRSYGRGGRSAENRWMKDYRAKLLRMRPVFVALLLTGSRLNEILRLEWQDVDLKEHPHIDPSIQNNSRQGSATRGRPSEAAGKHAARDRESPGIRAS
jgi:integrase